MRRLPTEPPASLRERLRPLPYFINNLAPGFRTGWIALIRRTRIDRFIVNDIPRLRPLDRLSSSTRRESPHAVVLSREGVLLGSIDDEPGDGPAIHFVNGGPQTTRPEMKPAMAAKLLKDHPYLLVTDAIGKYLGRYVWPQS
jgi:hypothetical protein